MTTRLLKQFSPRVIRWETVGLLVGLGGLLLGLGCNARDSRLYPKGLKRVGFELSGDDEESSVLAAFQLVQAGWGQPGLPGGGSVVVNMNFPKLFSALSSLSSAITRGCLYV